MLLGNAIPLHFMCLDMVKFCSNKMNLAIQSERIVSPIYFYDSNTPKGVLRDLYWKQYLALLDVYCLLDVHFSFVM